MEGLRRAGENPDVFTQTENLNRLLKELTEQDRTGLFLLENLCKLIEINLEWTEEDKELVYEAIELADYAHNGQKRGNYEYFSHPVRVAIRLYLRGASPEQVAAGLLHDAIEDNPLAVIAYLMGSSNDMPSFIGPTKEEQIDIATAMLYDSETFGSVALYVDAVTDRPYPLHIAEADNEAKHEHRADAIRKLGKFLLLLGALEIKNCDNDDNVGMLILHEALNDTFDALRKPAAEKHLEKLLNKYDLALDAFEEIARNGSPVVTLESVNYRREILKEVRIAANIVSPTEAEAIAA